MSDAVCATDGGSQPKPGAMIDTHQLASTLNDELHQILADGVDPTYLCHVQAGITASDLQAFLDHESPRQGLASRGGSGQTIAGMISTSTHSADSSVPPLNDSVQAIHLVGAGGVEYWIERTVPITDRERLRVRYPCLAQQNVLYNTEVFNAVLVAAGSMGVIYSVILKTVPQFGLRQHRVMTTWQVLKDSAGDGFVNVLDGSLLAGWDSSMDILGPSSPMLAPFLPNIYSQIVINPYPFYANDRTLSTFEANRAGENLCIITNRVAIPIPANPVNPGGGSSDITSLGAELGQTARDALGYPNVDYDVRFLNFKNSVAGQAIDTQASSLVDFLADFYSPGTISAVISHVLKRIEPSDGDRTDVSHKMAEVAGWGQSIRGLGVEAAFAPADALTFVDRVLAQVAAYAARNPQVFVAGYLSLRFVGKTAGLLGMQQWSPTCCVEYALLAGPRGADEFVRDLQELALSCGGNLHFGLNNDVMTHADLFKAHGRAKLDSFRWARGTVSQNGTLMTFDNSFTDRLELSAQIRDGSGYWPGGLYVSDSAGTLVERWEPTPQVEGHSSMTAVGLMNRSAQPITVSGLTITSSQDSGATRMFTLTSALPLTIQASTLTWVHVQFGPATAGPITGTVSVTCDDPTVPQFSVPLATSATPLGAHGLLQITPASFDFGTVRVGQSADTSITLTNVGTRDLAVDPQVTNAAPAGQFSVPLSSGPAIHPSASATVHLSCTPTVRGRLLATLSADATSQTDTPHPFQQHIDVPISATATAPVVFLAGLPLPPPGPIRRDPPGRPGLGLDRPLIDLPLLDFGAVPPGGTANRPFWIRNVGDEPLSVSSVDSMNPAAFGIPNLTIFPALIAPGGELAVDANFLAPSVPGLPVRGRLEILSDDPTRPRAVLVVTGRVAGPHLSLQPVEVLNLSGVTLPTGELTIVSDGSDPATLGKVGVSDPDFSISGLPGLPTALAPGTVLTISVTYTGSSQGEHNAYLVLEHDAVKLSVILNATT
jgi:hypothetical protein